MTERPRSHDTAGAAGAGPASPRRWHVSGHSPHLECRGCGMPIILENVERDGSRRALTCPYCERRDEWEIVDR